MTLQIFKNTIIVMLLNAYVSISEIFINVEGAWFLEVLKAATLVVIEYMICMKLLRNYVKHHRAPDAIVSRYS